MDNDKLTPLAKVIYNLESKLESAKTEIVRLDGAARATQSHVRSLDSWVANSKEELTKQVESGQVSIDAANFALTWLFKVRSFVSELSATTSKLHITKQGEALGLTDTINVTKSVMEEEIRRELLARQQEATEQDQTQPSPSPEIEAPETTLSTTRRGRPKTKVRPDEAPTRIGRAAQDIKSRRSRAKP